MPSPDFDDLADFFNTDDFAITAALEIDGQTREIIGIFDLTPLDASIGASDLDALPATFTTHSADVRDVKRGDLLTIDGEAYQARGHPKHDGTGIAIIELTPNGGDVRGTYV